MTCNMKQYAILEHGVPRIMGRVPHVSNASAEQLEAYASACGYKLLVYSACPGRFYSRSWKKTAGRITETWTPWELSLAKDEALRLVQEHLDKLLIARSTVPCIGIPAGIVYDPAALTNALGLEPGDMFIDAADKLHTLNTELIENIRCSLKNHRLGLYAAATDYRRRIAAADSVESLQDILNGI